MEVGRVNVVLRRLSHGLRCPFVAQGRLYPATGEEDFTTEDTEIEGRILDSGLRRNGGGAYPLHHETIG